MTLADLPAAFAASRIEASTAARYTTAGVPKNTCRYCGKFLKRWLSASIDGHGKCITTPVFQRAVYELWFGSPQLSRDAIAAACGVSLNCVVKWLENVERRIGRAA